VKALSQAEFLINWIWIPASTYSCESCFIKPYLKYISIHQDRYSRWSDYETITTNRSHDHLDDFLLPGWPQFTLTSSGKSLVLGMAQMGVLPGRRLPSPCLGRLVLLLSSQRPIVKVHCLFGPRDGRLNLEQAGWKPDLFHRSNPPSQFAEESLFCYEPVHIIGISPLASAQRWLICFSREGNISSWDWYGGTISIPPLKRRTKTT